jgi:hypothetical protein
MAGTVAGIITTTAIGEIGAADIVFDGPASRARFLSTSQVLGSARAGSDESAAMMTWFGAAIMIATLMPGVTATIQPVAAASVEVERHAAPVPDMRTHRHHRDRNRYVYRPEEQPRYYGRPVYYTPAPFVPLPPLFGYGWEPPW